MAVIEITEENFEKEVRQAEQTVLLDFWAAWCGPCQMLAPTLQAVAEERSDVKVGKINADECHNLVAAYRIMSLPTLLVLKDGVEVNRLVGVSAKEEITALLPPKKTSTKESE